MRQGFQISANHPDRDKAGVSSYTEADSPKELVIRVLQQFPPEEGWHNHEAWATAQGSRPLATVLKLTPDVCQAALV